MVEQSRPLFYACSEEQFALPLLWSLNNHIMLYIVWIHLNANYSVSGPSHVIIQSKLGPLILCTKEMEVEWLSKQWKQNQKKIVLFHWTLNNRISLIIKFNIHHSYKWCPISPSWTCLAYMIWLPWILPLVDGDLDKHRSVLSIWNPPPNAIPLSRCEQ